MTIRLRSGSERLVRGVRRYFQENAISAVVDFGDRALTKQINQGPGCANRVVFCPFDPRSGDAGTLQEPARLGLLEIMREDDPTERVGSTRSLWDWRRQFVVSVWAFAELCPEDDFAQDCAAETLLEDVINAVHDTAFADVAWSQISVVTQGERRFGRELRARLAFTHPLFERPADVSFPELALTKAMTTAEFETDETDDE